MINGCRDFTNEEYIEAITELEPASTTEVAEYVGCTNENARIGLNKLYDSDDIQRKRYLGDGFGFLIDYLHHIVDCPVLFIIPRPPLRGRSR